MIKKDAPIEELKDNVLYSCIQEKKRANEQFVPEHTMGYIMSGTAQFITATGVALHGPGSIGLVRKNTLVKTIKIPPPDGSFRSISMNFPQEALSAFSTKHNVKAVEKYSGTGMHPLQDNLFIKGFFDSLVPYFDSHKPFTPAMREIKTNEAIELLLQHDPALKNLLFDFSTPYKIDIAGYMNQNYMFNIPMAQFAVFTGRSLATFKRDFTSIFGVAPGRWLQQKRLSVAYSLIKDEGKKASDVYLDVGFENLSHFSFVFKKTYGKSPTKIV